MAQNDTPAKALVLAGGGARGSYQVGVWRALTELGWRPQIITGTSVGSSERCHVCAGPVRNGPGYVDEHPQPGRDGTAGGKRRPL